MSKGRRAGKLERQRRCSKNPFRPDSMPMFWQQQGYQQQLYLMFRDDIISLALSRFKWVGLPETCDAAYLEWTLLYQGAATIAYPKGNPGTFYALQAVQQGTPNMYSYPTAWRARGDTGRTDFACDWSNGVFLYDNKTGYPLLSKINIWARELADIITTKQVNRFHMRMPFAITAPQDRAMDAQNFYKQVANGEPVVLAYDTFSDIQVDTTMPERSREYIGDKLDQDFEQTWNHVYRELGIDSLPYKEERMIEDEVSSTMEPTQMARLSPLSMRRAACRKLNERFGKYLSEPIRCVWNSDIVSDNYDLMHNVAHRMEVIDDGVSGTV